MFHYRKYSSCLRATRGGELLPVVSCRPTEAHGHHANRCGASEAGPSNGRSPAILCRELESNHTGPVGPGSGRRLCDTVHEPAVSALPSEGPGPLLRGGKTAPGRDNQHACKASDREDHAQRAGFPLHGVSRTEEGRRPKAGDKPEGVERLCAYRALQDGGHPRLERPAKSGGLDGKDRFERRIFHASHPRGGQSIPKVLAKRPDLPVQVPTFRSSVRPLGLHQDPEADSCPAETAGGANDRLHRRYSDPGRVQGSGSGPCNRPGVPTGKLGFCNKQNQMSAGTNTNHRVSRFHGRLTQPRAEFAKWQDQKDQSRDTVPVREQAGVDKETFAAPGKAPGCDAGDSPRPTLFPQAPTCLEAGTRPVRSGLLAAADALRGRAGGAAVVARPPVDMEWQNVHVREAVGGDRVGCLHLRLGGDVRRCTHGRPMVSGGATMAHKLPGGASSLPRGEMLCQRQKRRFCAAEVGQYLSRLLHQQAGRDGVPQAKRHCQRPVAVVHEQGYYPDSRTPPRGPECSSRRRVPSDEGSLGLDAEPSGIQQDPEELGPSGSGLVCIQTDDPAGAVLQLETRPRGGGSGCVQPRLAGTAGESLCQPSMEPGRESVDEGMAAGDYSSADCTSVEEPAMVSSVTGVPSGFPNPSPSEEGTDHSDTPRECPSNPSPTSRLAYLRRRYQDKEISQEGTELLLASWRQKSSKSYDSLFKKWVVWCGERSSDPVSGPVSEVVNFLATLFKEGYQYRSLNSYRSAISSVHERVDGYEVGQHPLVSRVMKGAFNLRPPQPRYETTWDVSKVLDFIVSLGPSENLSLRDLTWKLAMLLALTRPSRSADLAKLDLRFRRITPEGVVFQEAGLAKQSRSGRTRAEFFFPGFEDPLLCPKATLKVYEGRTECFRKQGETEHTRLFLAVVKPHKPVCSSTLARWLKSLLEKAGIDTGIFKAHSVRGAATSAAANAGVTMADILKAADWSSETVFSKFYYKPVRSGAFGSAVLSKKQPKELQTTTVDMETEPSEI